MSAGASIDAFLNLNHSQFSAGLKTALSQTNSFASNINKLFNSIKAPKMGDFGSPFKLTKKELEDVAKELEKLKKSTDDTGKPFERLKRTSNVALSGMAKDVMDAQAKFGNLGMSVRDVQAKLAIPSGDNLVKAAQEAQSSFANLNTDITTTYSKLSTPIDLKIVDAVNEAQSAFGHLNNNATTTFSNISKSANDSQSSVNSINSTVDTVIGYFGRLGNAATSAASNIAKSFSDAGSSTNSLVHGLGSVEGALSNVSYTAQTTSDNVTKSMTNASTATGNLTQGLGGVRGAFAGILGVIGTQSIGEMIFGNSMKAEVNQVLLKGMADTKTSAKDLFKTIDTSTNSALVSMQQAVPAINAIAAATQSTGTQMNAVSPGIISFGSYVYALTGSAAKAETAMFDLSKGIKGAYASLDQYGITEDSLMATGLWSGKESDLQGYINAVNAVTGSTDELMDTTQGKITQIYKKLSVGAKALGNELLPLINTVVDGFLSLNEATGGNLAKGIMGAGLALSGFLVIGAAKQTVFPMLKDGFKSLGGVIGKLGGIMGTATNKTSVFNKVLENLNGNLNGGSTGGGSGKKGGKTPSNSSGPGFLDRMGGMNKAQFFTKVKGIAATIALATVAIGMLIAPLTVLAGLGVAYKTMESQVKKGAESFIIVGSITAVVLAAIFLFQTQLMVMGSAAEMIALPMAKGIAITMLLATEAILLLNAPLLAIGLLGFVFGSIEGQVRQGIEAIKLVGQTVMEIAPALILFSVAVAFFGLVPLAGILAASGIAITMALTVEAIILLEAPLTKIAELGGKFSDLSGVQSGVNAIKSALAAVKMIGELFAEADKIVTGGVNYTGYWVADAVLFIQDLVSDKASLDDLINVISGLEDFINKFNNITASLPKVDNVDALKNVATVITDVNEVITGVTGGLKGINAMQWETGWNNINVDVDKISGPFDKLGDLVVGVSNFIKNSAGKIKGIPKIETENLEGLKSAATTITEISKVSTEMEKAVKSISGMNWESNWNNWITGNEKQGPFDMIGSIVDGVINFMNNNKGKLDGIDAEAMKEFGEKFRQVTSGFNYFLNDANTIIPNLSTLNKLTLPDDNTYFKIEKFVDQIKNRMGNLKGKMEGINPEDYDGIGENFRKLTSQFGYFVNDTVKISNSLNSLTGVEEPDWSLFSRIETITGRVITSLNKLKEKIDPVADIGNIGETWRNISSQFMYFANDYNKINSVMSTMGDEPIPYEKFSNLEITIGRVITSLKEISKKVTTSGINGDSGAAGISSAIQAVADTISQINTALTNANGVEGAAKSLGAKIPAGIKAGINGANLGTEIISSITTAINAGNSYFTSSGKRLGTSLANGFRSTAIQLKTIAAAEVDWALNAINTRASKFWTAGARLGSSLLGGYKDAQNIASPGLVAKTTDQEMNYALSMIESTIPTAYTMASTLGSSIVSGFGSPSLEVGDTEGLSQVQTNAQTALGLVQNTAMTTTSTFAGVDSTLQGSFAHMALSANNTFSNVNTTSSAQMKDMATKTSSEIGNIKSSWLYMQNALISSASTIRTQTASHINKLQGNMASFWRKVRSPVLLLGGAAGGYAGSPSLTRNSLSVNRGYAGNPIADKNITGNQGIKLLREDNPYPCFDDNCFAGWELSRWTPNIKSKVGNWKTNFGHVYDPYLNVGKFTNSNFPVRGNPNVFKAFIMDAIGRTSYQFYYNSKGGSPASIYSSGSFNCWDGYRIVEGFANAFGLPCNMERGTWNGIPHVWANVGGVGRVDATAIQQRGSLFASSAVAAGGPVPKSAPSNGEGKIVKHYHKHVTVDMTGATINGEKDFRDKMKDIADEVFNEKWDDNPYTG